MSPFERMRIHSPSDPVADSEAINSLKSGFGHRSPFDAPLISAAAARMWDAGRDAGTILEVCCGYGELLAGLARAFPRARVVGMDQFPGTVEIASRKIAGLDNAEVYARDVMCLDDWEDGSVDLVIGQATLHHLTHNPRAALEEFARVLRPGGICMFTFEPLSHNHIVNTVRSYRNARQLLTDESNLYLETIESLSAIFSSTEVQCFNLTTSFLLKALRPSPPLLHLASMIRALDAWRFARSERALAKASNMNVIFTK